MTPTSEPEVAGLVEPALGLQIPWLSVQEEEVSVCEERVSAVTDHSINSCPLRNFFKQSWASSWNLKCI